MTKVQLESHDDLQYLLQEFKYATNQSLQHHGNTLSAAAYQEVKKRLNKWVETIFELAGENVEINGLPYTSDLPHQTGSKSYCINIPGEQLLKTFETDYSNINTNDTGFRICLIFI
ncbi:hypothetical protein BC833DRAFT_622507 [Globomyces pollinis-pini]|nr:hypothetical protein BC833DRAFT_622507 [Globomyces pollinis-pini]